MQNNTIKWKVESITVFAAIESQWNDLNKELNGSSVLASLFINALIKEFSSGSEKIVTGWKNEKLVFAGIFEKLSKYRWRTFQPSQAPLGCFLCADAYLTYAVIKQVSNLLPNRPVLLDFTQLDSSLFLTENKPSFSYSTYIQTGKLDVPEDFDKYFAAFSKNTRQNFNKARNRLKREGVETSLKIIEDKVDVAQAVEQYGNLESAGWKSTQGTAIHKDNEQGRFYISLLEKHAENKQTQIWCYYFNDEPVAVDLCILEGGVIIILKTTYNESYSKYSPSLLMKLDAYKKMSEDKQIHTIEYFGPVKDWHRRLTCHEREVFHLTWCKYPMLFKCLQWFKNLR